MKLLQKFNTYLLENYPLLWHTRAIQLTFVGLLVWLVSFLAGYLSTDLTDLRVNNFNFLYGSSQFVYYHIGMVIIIVALWAIFFYKNNAFKSFYPLKRFYFHKMLGLLFVPFFLLVAAPVAHNSGARAKTMSLLSLDQLKKDAAVINIASAFLLSNHNDYKIEEKAYPEPFPLERTEFDENNRDWDYSANSLYLQKDVPVDEKKYTIEKPYTRYKIDDSNTSIIDGRKYQFFSTKIIRIDSCSQKKVIDKFYVFDSTDQLNLVHIENYSKMIIDDSEYLDPEIIKAIGKFKEIKEMERARRKDLLYSLNMEDFMINQTDNFPKKYFAQAYSKEIKRLTKNKDGEKLIQLLEQFNDVLTRYKIPGNISPQYITAVWLTNDFNEYFNFVDSYNNKTKYTNFYPEAIDRSVYESLKGFDPQSEKLHTPGYQYYELNDLTNVFRNYLHAEEATVANTEWIFYLYFTLSIACVFLFFEIVKPISFIISLPVWGVLFILYGVILASLSNTKPTHALFMIFILFLIVQILNLWFLMNKKVSKKILNISYSMALVSAPFILGVLFSWIHHFFVFETFRDCGYYPKKYHILNGWLVEGSTIWFTALAGILIILLLPKRWKSREE